MAKAPTTEKARAVINMERPDEYTEWDKKSRSAPVEILTEFLTAIMLKDYETALKHCSQILTYEPKNSTAKEFYPLILKKLEIVKSEELDNSSESDDSTYSASDSSSFHQDTDNLKSSSSSSESSLSLEEADDEQGLRLKTSPFGSQNLNATQTERADVKKHVLLPSTSQNEENSLQTPSKKERTSRLTLAHGHYLHPDQFIQQEPSKATRNQKWTTKNSLL